MCRVARARGSLQPSDLEGQRVRLCGLSGRPDLNGQIGTVRFFDAQKLRHAIQLDTGEGARASEGWHASGPPVLVRQSNLEMIELETAAMDAAREDEILRAERYIECAIERSPGDAQTSRRLRLLMSSLYQAQLHRATLAAAEHANALTGYASRSQVPDDLWDTIREQEQQCRSARQHCDAAYVDLLNEVCRKIRGCPAAQPDLEHCGLCLTDCCHHRNASARTACLTPTF
jgi:hypothetical protein